MKLDCSHTGTVLFYLQELYKNVHFSHTSQTDARAHTYAYTHAHTHVEEDSSRVLNVAVPHPASGG